MYTKIYINLQLRSNDDSVFVRAPSTPTKGSGIVRTMRG